MFCLIKNSSLIKKFCPRKWCWRGGGCTPLSLRLCKWISTFRAKSLPFCIAYRFVWSQICFTSSFKLVFPSNISNGLAFSGISNNTCASGMHFFALTNLDVRFHSNSVTFFVTFLPCGSSISKTSPSTWTVASGIRGWWLYSLLSGICSSAMYSVSESSKRFFSVPLSFLLSIENISLLPISYRGLYMTSTLMHFLYKITINSQVMLAVMSITVDITIDLPDIPLVISLSTSFAHNCRFSS